MSPLMRHHSCAASCGASQHVRQSTSSALIGPDPGTARRRSRPAGRASPRPPAASHSPAAGARTGHGHRIDQSLRRHDHTVRTPLRRCGGADGRTRALATAGAARRRGVGRQRRFICQLPAVSVSELGVYRPTSRVDDRAATELRPPLLLSRRWPIPDLLRKVRSGTVVGSSARRVGGPWATCIAPSVAAALGPAVRCHGQPMP